MQDPLGLNPDWLLLKRLFLLIEELIDTVKDQFFKDF